MGLNPGISKRAGFMLLNIAKTQRNLPRMQT